MQSINSEMCNFLRLCYTYFIGSFRCCDYMVYNFFNKKKKKIIFVLRLNYPPHTSYGSVRISRIYRLQKSGPYSKGLRPDFFRPNSIFSSSLRLTEPRGKLNFGKCDMLYSISNFSIMCIK